jgi:hypothetical protein
MTRQMENHRFSTPTVTPTTKAREKGIRSIEERIAQAPSFDNATPEQIERFHAAMERHHA